MMSVDIRLTFRGDQMVDLTAEQLHAIMHFAGADNEGWTNLITTSEGLRLTVRPETVATSWHVNIQYKGTDICLDFVCPHCDAEAHFDGYFQQVLTCPGCSKLWQLPNSVPLEEVTAETAIMIPAHPTPE